MSEDPKIFKLTESDPTASNPTEEELRRERISQERQRYHTILGEFFSDLPALFLNVTPLVVYASTALEVLSEDRQSYVADHEAAHDIDILTSEDGLRALASFARDYKKAGLEVDKESIKVLMIGENPSIHPSGKRSINLKFDLVYWVDGPSAPSRRLTVDVWSGLGEGKLSLTRKEEAGSLIEGVNLEDDSVIITHNYVGLDGEERQAFIRTLTPGAVIEAYRELVIPIEERDREVNPERPIKPMNLRYKVIKLLDGLKKITVP
jgi:hypothetical protein